MAEKIEVSSPVAIASDSKQRVAFELAVKISDHSGIDYDKKDKKYWLSLYRQCYKAVSGNSLEHILKED